MGTRGFMVFFYRGLWIALYNQYDSHAHGLGAAIIQQLVHSFVNHHKNWDEWLLRMIEIYLSIIHQNYYQKYKQAITEFFDSSPLCVDSLITNTIIEYSKPFEDGKIYDPDTTSFDVPEYQVILEAAQMHPQGQFYLHYINWNIQHRLREILWILQQDFKSNDHDNFLKDSAIHHFRFLFNPLINNNYLWYEHIWIIDVEQRQLVHADRNGKSSLSIDKLQDINSVDLDTLKKHCFHLLKKNRNQKSITFNNDWFQKKGYRKCEYCNGIGINMKRCARCKKVYYCSVECQKAHWKYSHKLSCKNKTVEEQKKLILQNYSQLLNLNE